MRQNIYVFSFHRDPDLDDWLFDWLLTSMADMQVEELYAYFLLVGDLNRHHQEWLGFRTTNRHGPRAKVIRVRNKDKPWFDDQCRHAFSLKQEAHLRPNRDHYPLNWEDFVLCLVRVNEINLKATRQFSDRNSGVLMNVHSSHNWWSTLKSVVFGYSSSLPSLVV